MHLIPDRYRKIFCDVKNFESPQNHLIPFGESKDTIICDYNFDGIIFHSSVHDKHGYTQMFRDGRIETVVAIAQNSNDGKTKVISLLQLQKKLIACLSNHLTVIQKFSIEGPYHLFFRLLSVENLRVSPADIAKAGYDAKGRNKSVIRNELIFPKYTLEHADVDIKACLLPFFDVLWNTFGFSGAPIK